MSKQYSPIFTRDFIYKPKELLDQIISEQCLSSKLKLDDKIVSIRLNKLKVFQRDNASCSCCGAPGLMVIPCKLWKNQHFFSLRFFVIGHDNNPIELTIDHVFPKSAGGGDQSDNLTSMCLMCNSTKAENKTCIKCPNLQLINRTMTGSQYYCDILKQESKMFNHHVPLRFKQCPKVGYSF